MTNLENLLTRAVEAVKEADEARINTLKEADKDENCRMLETTRNYRLTVNEKMAASASCAFTEAYAIAAGMV
ncbi:MAG: hypothetical protein LBT88_08155 [Oscillospiraceae bacterium]|jgi:hypothetical protein|nr:hypothetical protein [Oscillospiraceae bacterium]